MVKYRPIATARRGPQARKCLLGLMAALGAAILSACAGDKGPPPPCPEVVGVTGASNMVRFRSAGRDLTDVEFEAQIRDAALVCEYDDNVIEADMRLSIEALRGPANADQIARFGYFVAIATRTREVLVREEFQLEIPLPGNQTRVAAIEEISQRIPLKAGESGADYVIFVGLNLTPEEFQYNVENR